MLVPIHSNHQYLTSAVVAQREGNSSGSCSRSSVSFDCLGEDYVLTFLAESEVYLNAGLQEHLHQP